MIRENHRASGSHRDLLSSITAIEDAGKQFEDRLNDLDKCLQDAIENSDSLLDGEKIKALESIESLHRLADKIFRHKVWAGIAIHRLLDEVEVINSQGATVFNEEKVRVSTSIEN